MSSQRLMCVWQAIHDHVDPSAKTITLNNVRQVSAAFTKHQMIKFSALDFAENFKGDDIDFEAYVNYVKKQMAHSKSVYSIVEEAIEDMCWDFCKDKYDLDLYHTDEEDCRKMWEVFMRLSVSGSYPPKIEREEIEWLGEKICSHLGQHWQGINTPDELEFTGYLEHLSSKCFHKASHSAIGKAVDDLYSWLVKEVAMTGWLYKRTRKQANWTSWVKRWFVLTPRRLCYYDGPRQKEKKGEVALTSHSKFEELPEFKSLARRFPHRSRITNSPYLEIDLSASDEHERAAWKDAILEIIAASKDGTTPVEAILKERRKQKEAGKNYTLDQATARLKSFKLKSFHKKRDEIEIEEAKVKLRDRKRPSFPQLMPLNIEDRTIQTEIAKIQDVFRKVDKKGKGAVDEEQFRAFIHSLGLKINNEAITNIFSNIEVSRDGVITIDEFINYFMSNVLDERGGSSSKADAKLRAAFLRADRDGTGSVNFREFAEYFWEKRRSCRLSRVMTVFDAMNDGKGEVSYEQFRAFFSSQRTSLISECSENGDEADQGHRSPTLEDHLRAMYNEADAENMASFLRQRWDSFASFKRPGESGTIAMHGGHGMVADVLPGSYNLVDLACFTDLPPITPRHVVIHNTKWIHSIPGGHGKAIFPHDFDGVLPIEIATTEHLQYYGASLADSTQVQISLMYRHGIQDFTYMNEYLEDYVKTRNGGAGLEMHEFSHLDCPLETDSGHFVLGKMVGDGDLHLTAFYVPVRHSVYVPGGTIHSNDYLKGTWRTMLSDEAEIDHVHLVRRNQNDPNGLDHFTFSFK